MAQGDAIREIINTRLDELNPTTRSILEHSQDETVRKAYAKLLELGLTGEKIASQAQLLGRDPEMLQRNADALKKLGLTDEKIATNAALLGRDPETLQRNADALKKLGLTGEKITSRAELLGRDPETLQRNYECLRRFFSKDEITANAQLLGISKNTLLGSVQFLSALGVDYHKLPFACGTKVGTKRKKIAVLLREKYNYDANLNENERRELAEKAREFVRARPYILKMGEKAIKKTYC
ncbi:hypothetical protein H0O02_05260 [Candidatus Micrarchaeota archaeon]|nr:hypothetical protein [Candidatus Micrarchaeota archaeon]